MARKYFGTDGIRGKIGRYPMTPDFVLKLGWAAGKVLASTGHPLVLIGKDTRISGYMLESALQAGLVAAGVNIRLLGPMPTPAVAYLTRAFRASAGIVISASHNPYDDNGVKFFSGKGTKLPDSIEEEIESWLEKEFKTVSSDELGKVERAKDAAGRYIEFCKRALPSDVSLKGLRIVVDCANGATYHVAPDVLRELGAEVIAIANDPDGLNINDECGATHVQGLQETVSRYRADAGIALDGDGDRLIMVDQKGQMVDGDEILAIIAHHRHADGKLQGGVVGTLMSNLGLEKAVEALGVPFYRANVGDRYVIELMEKHDCDLGGESSGHIIVRDFITTGDGIIAALQVLRAMRATGKSLHDLKQVMLKYPQTLINVPTRQKINLNESESIQSVVRQVEEVLGSRGRVLLRASGTEPLIRVMVEGEDAVETKALAETIAEAVRTAA
ncbi:MAG TPA: phosphoglucosamine mutase [Candidatus Thiothrix moscowensis]|uniref:phosphoglucosamine mutase n=1 Tax=unclassified Thiothrix TaxID=2636184 RepID=UPI0025E094BC|nr:MULTISPECIES: phosphoglucosamine mutase [unclassified Thiothrix]HRJ53348.1 phosphoglucosamine mutase [Candidatus Thiothrix moscowensis]HRJ94187.1 phosphoglucosamine mutase [Candidatus Thiothrix moscowensis]